MLVWARIAMNTRTRCIAINTYVIEHNWLTEIGIPQNCLVHKVHGACQSYPYTLFCLLLCYICHPVPRVFRHFRIMYTLLTQECHLMQPWHSSHKNVISPRPVTSPELNLFHQMMSQSRILSNCCRTVSWIQLLVSVFPSSPPERCDLVVLPLDLRD